MIDESSRSHLSSQLAPSRLNPRSIISRRADRRRPLSPGRRAVRSDKMGRSRAESLSTGTARPPELHRAPREPMAETEAERPTNRLADETSPYLLQHAHNPVAWYPWGPEALAKAKAEDRPIFLSIGYSTCFWCHVAERTIYSDPSIARLMNEWFINIKVDREERPDIDQAF